MPLFQRRTEAFSRCTTILEEKGAQTRSYCLEQNRISELYFRREKKVLNRNLWTILEENEDFKQSYCLYFRGEGSRQTELLPLFQQNGVSVVEDGMPLFQRRTEALSSCASILEEKGALTRSYSLYFRGEGSLQTELLPLFQSSTGSLDYFRGRFRFKTFFSLLKQSSDILFCSRQQLRASLIL